MNTLYSKEIMEHFKNPKNVGRIKNPSGLGRAGNKICGDIMYLYLKIKRNRKGVEIISDIKYETYGCVVAIANTSLLSTMIKGKTLEEAAKVTKEDLIKKFKQVPLIKIHCSLLAVDALSEAIYDYFLKNKREISEELQKKHERIEKEKKEIGRRHAELVKLEEELHGK
ncbi:MAG: iron-sulfur cluster assembly scaffold protein [bacterium]|nr:iron-sulfur cluster assembly scaffold protein [bacterium]